MTEGFCAEQGMNEIVPPYESLQKYIPADDLAWPIRNPDLNPVWTYHAGTNGTNTTLECLVAAIAARYGDSNSVEEFSFKAQVDQYELNRAHMESFAARGWETHKGTIYWMLNSHWPGTFGHIFDCYLKPGGAYYGIKKGTRPLSVVFDLYGSGNGSTANFYVTNQTLQEHSNLKVLVKYYNIDLTEKYANEVTGVTVNALDRTNVMQVGSVNGLSSTYFVRLWLKDANDNVLVENFYWQSTQPDVVSNYEVFGTKMSQYADYSALNTLPAVDVAVSSNRVISGNKETATVTLTNNANSLAFFTRVEILRGPNGEEVKPITYSDNYVSLFPSESIDIVAAYKTSDLQAANAFVRVEGYNVNQAIVSLQQKSNNISKE
jgi:exo-1,4-beta-D-glucosaminidase